MKKRIIAIAIGLLVSIPITVFAVIETRENKEYFSQARLEELEKKQEFIDSGKKSLTALEKGLPEEEQSMSEEEIAALVEKDRLAEERAAIETEYTEKVVSLINKVQNKKYTVTIDFSYELMRAAIDTIQTGTLTQEEETLLKGYIGEHAFGVLDTDPMYDEIMDILDLPY